ncbi:MAG: trigger factor [Alphaproteobacteria bacterium]|nr:trigger factor [Alphaproteobacteria bacterium]
MAKVQVLNQDGLKHEFSVTVPMQDVADKTKLRLVEIGKTAKMPGFRPGKVPMAVIEQRHGQEARAEAVDQAVSDAAEQALSEHKLRPAMQPKIELVTFAEGKDVEFKMAVEVLPEIKLNDFSSIALERPVAEVADAKVDETITTFAKRFRQPEAVTDARAARMGDVLVINFDGSVGGEKRDGMKGEKHNLELGSKSFIDTFEDQLVGSKAGDKKTIKVTFPDQYHAADLAGQKAEFDVEILEILQHKPVELNDELAKEMGFPSIDTLRERVRTDIDTDYQRISRSVVKRQLMDQLAAAYAFVVPESLLDAEFNGIWAQVDDARKKGELPEEDKKKSEDELRKEYRVIAERRIRLGLVLAEVAQQNKIEVTGNELRNALMAEARRYPGQEKAVFDYYTQTQGAMERIRAPLLEEKVIDHIVGKAKVTDKKMSAEELLKLPEEE